MIAHAVCAYIAFCERCDLDKNTLAEILCLV